MQIICSRASKRTAWLCKSPGPGPHAEQPDYADFLLPGLKKNSLAMQISCSRASKRTALLCKSPAPGPQKEQPGYANLLVQGLTQNSLIMQISCSRASKRTAWVCRSPAPGPHHALQKALLPTHPRRRLAIFFPAPLSRLPTLFARRTCKTSASEDRAVYGCLYFSTLSNADEPETRLFVAVRSYKNTNKDSPGSPLVEHFLNIHRDWKRASNVEPHVSVACFWHSVAPIQASIVLMGQRARLGAADSACFLTSEILLLGVM